MKGYTSTADLAKYLGREFDDNQDAIADLAISAAEEIIDQKTSVSFKESDPKTVSIWGMDNPLVRLNDAGPATALSVNALRHFDGTVYPISEGADYEIRSLNPVTLWFPYYQHYYRLDITYTPSPTVPSRIKMAANVLAAHWMRPILNDEMPGIANLSIGGELTVAFTEYVQKQGYPAEVDLLLGIPTLYIA